MITDTECKSPEEYQRDYATYLRVKATLETSAKENASNTDAIESFLADLARNHTPEQIADYRDGFASGRYQYLGTPNGWTERKDTTNE